MNRCRAPFALQSDFAECYALQCPRCPTTFCAWCLGDVSAAADPHAHVIDCEQAPSDMLGHALFLRDDNGGPHVPPNPARKFERHWLFRKAVGVREVAPKRANWHVPPIVSGFVWKLIIGLSRTVGISQ